MPLQGTIHLEMHPCKGCQGHRVLNAEELASFHANVDAAIEDARREGRATHGYIGQEPAEIRCEECPRCEECDQLCELGAIELREHPEPPVGQVRTVEWFCGVTCLTTHRGGEDAAYYAYHARRV
jgi:NAD-dependent dihydropyrimidine dehydrogenase PreA subunit